MSEETVIIVVLVAGRILLAAGLVFGGYYCVKTGWSTYKESISKISGQQAGGGGGEHSFSILGILTINSKSKEVGIATVLTSCVWIAFAYACIPKKFETPGGYRFAGPGDVQMIDGQEYVLVPNPDEGPDHEKVSPEVYATPDGTPNVFGPERREENLKEDGRA